MANNSSPDDELKRLLARDVFTRVANIRAACARNDFDIIKREAHKIAGAASYCRDDELERCARELLHSVESPSGPPGTRTSIVDALDAAVQKYHEFQSEDDSQ